jgi:hypothetical protein
MKSNSNKYEPELRAITGHQAKQMLRSICPRGPYLRVLLSHNQLVSEKHKAGALRELNKLYDEIKRGRTHCIERSQVAHLIKHIKAKSILKPLVLEASRKHIEYAVKT